MNNIILEEIMSNKNSENDNSKNDNNIENDEILEIISIFKDCVKSTPYISNSVCFFAPNSKEGFKTNHCMANKSDKTFKEKAKIKNSVLFYKKGDPEEPGITLPLLYAKSHQLPLLDMP